MNAVLAVCLSAVVLGSAAAGGVYCARTARARAAALGLDFPGVHRSDPDQGGPYGVHRSDPDQGGPYGFHRSDPDHGGPYGVYRSDPNHGGPYGVQGRSTGPYLHGDRRYQPDLETALNDQEDIQQTVRANGPPPHRPPLPRPPGSEFTPAASPLTHDPVQRQARPFERAEYDRDLEESGVKVADRRRSAAFASRGHDPASAGVPGWVAPRRSSAPRAPQRRGYSWVNPRGRASSVIGRSASRGGANRMRALTNALPRAGPQQTVKRRAALTHPGTLFYSPS